MKIFNSTSRKGPRVALSILALLAAGWLVTAAPAWVFMALGMGAGVGLAGVLGVASVLALGDLLARRPHWASGHRPKLSH